MVQVACLKENYRNSLAIKSLYEFIITHHHHQCPKLQRLASYDNLKDDGQRPAGSTPVWITVDGKVSDEEAVEYLSNHPEYCDRLREGQFQVALIEKIDEFWKLR